jgi:2-oxoglutarate ferredoxin oxidoreductase subunit alpha
MPGLIANANRVNDFVVKFANVNGTGSASANSLVMKAIFRMGVPVTGKNYFPSNIQGLPTWYEIRVTRDGYAARAAHVDIGRLPDLRLDMAAQLAPATRRYHGDRSAAREIGQ